MLEPAHPSTGVSGDGQNTPGVISGALLLLLTGSLGLIVLHSASHLLFRFLAQ